MTTNYAKTIIDLGTGDGRFIFKMASAHPENYFIGIDPSEKQLQIYLKKINRNKLNNAKLLVGSLEKLPTEILGTADELNIILPWGTLMQSIVKPTQESIAKITSLLKKPAVLKVILGYHTEAEPNESSRLELPELSEKYLKEKVITQFTSAGFKLLELKQINKDDLNNLETTWGKKLRFGKDRPIFSFQLEYC